MATKKPAAAETTPPAGPASSIEERIAALQAQVKQQSDDAARDAARIAALEAEIERQGTLGNLRDSRIANLAHTIAKLEHHAGHLRGDQVAERAAALASFG